MSTPCRCKWCEKDPLYIKYHDTEWGVPVHDDQKLFECLLLETFQAGLSWITVLRKRENFRKAFDHFDYHKIALYDEGKIQELLQDTGIVRNKLKVRATVSNAKAFWKYKKNLAHLINIYGLLSTENPFKTNGQQRKSFRPQQRFQTC